MFDVRVDKLGPPQDGWDDTVEGQGDKAAMLKEAFAAELKRRNLPNVTSSSTMLSTGGVAGKRRPYYIVRNYAGALVAVYIADFGRDLYLAWDLFVRRKVKWINLGIVFGIALVLSILTVWLFQGIQEDVDIADLEEIVQISRVVCTSVCFIIWVIVVGVGAALAGLELHGNRFAFFVQDVGDGYQQIQWRNIAIMAGLVLALTLLEGVLLAWFFVIVLVALISAKILRGKANAFFVEVQDHFAYSDTRALTRTVHKALLRSVDAVGLDASLLRPRELFRDWRRDRVI